METLQPPDRTSARVIEAYCAFLDSPTARLRFIRKAVARCQAESTRARSRLPLFERFHVRKIVIEELVPLLPSSAALPFSIRLALWTYRLRVPLYSLAVMMLIAVVTGLGYATVNLGAQTLESSRVASNALGPAPGPAAGDAGPLDITLQQYAPEQIWLVERTDDQEVYSNGARILTEFEVDADSRRFIAFPVGSADPATGVEKLGAPIGIVYHTSQSHIAPFREEFNDRLQDSSRGLLGYVRSKKLYNYVIDRFGRIYRVVKDDAIADHAGNSVWSDGSSTYLDLSSAFLGICFEAEWSPEVQLAPDQINEAQIYAGRVLTAMLRSRYQIEDRNCVTHAIVSVSPSSGLIGYHMDWGRGFPFAALGLSDKYDVETPSVGLFGFGHDKAFDRAVGTPWPGIGKAEARIEAEALETGVEQSQHRRHLQSRYREFRRWLSQNQKIDTSDGG